MKWLKKKTKKFFGAISKLLANNLLSPSKKVMVIQFISLKIGDFNLAKCLIISNCS